MRTDSCVLLFTLTTATLAGMPTVHAQTPASIQSEWWNTPYPKPFDAASLTTSLGFLSVEGNRIVNEQGEPVLLQGVSISDPDKLSKNGYWSRHHLEVVKQWGADIVRVPVHPVAWRERGKKGYFELLDQAVIWASELDLYLMIDWHSIGNLLSGLFQHPMYDTTRQETLEFWRSVAFRYRGIPTVAFYEIFNEPTDFMGQLGSLRWPEWKRFNEEVIRIIFAHDRRVIPLVAGFDWAYELKSVRQEPIEIEGIGYVSHPYPQKTTAPFEENWEADFGFVADTYPVFVTEFGFMPADAPGAHLPTIGDEDYGRRVTDYFKRKNISWAAWCFDPEWGPQLISDWRYTATGPGEFFREVMQAE